MYTCDIPSLNYFDQLSTSLDAYYQNQDIMHGIRAAKFIRAECSTTDNRAALKVLNNFLTIDVLVKEDKSGMKQCLTH